MTSGFRFSGPHRHLCWSYDDPAEFDARARDFLLEGLAAGTRVWYVAPGEPDVIADRLRGVGDFCGALRRGAARVIPLGSAYAPDFIIEPAAQVDAYATATEEAQAAGFTGLRVVAEATALVRTPEQLAAFARYEHLVDRYMRRHPMSALCAYHRPELGDRTIAELACLHPENNVDGALFRLYGCDPGEGSAALAGELDPSNHELFSTALERADLEPIAGRLVVEATGLRYIDHRSLLHLQDYAVQRDATAVLRTPLSMVTRLVELLALSRVGVEVAR